MKKSIALLILLIGIQGWLYAQSADTTASEDPGFTAGTPKKPVSPTERAARQLTILQKKLNLDEDQVARLRLILLRQNIALDSIRSNPSGDAKADNKARKAINQEADGRTYALLTLDQQLLYAQLKIEQRQKAMERRLSRQQAAGATPTPPAQATPTQPQAVQP